MVCISETISMHDKDSIVVYIRIRLGKSPKNYSVVLYLLK